jgi:hypothetical protein
MKAKKGRAVDRHGRKAGHLKPRESVTDWEGFWVRAYSDEGFGYRLIASMVYGVPQAKVTDTEIVRVGRIARAAGQGCNQYRTGQNATAIARIQELAGMHRDHGPPKLKLGRR